jgi:hypothetical protein
MFQAILLFIYVIGSLLFLVGLAVKINNYIACNHNKGPVGYFIILSRRNSQLNGLRHNLSRIRSSRYSTSALLLSTSQVL